MSEGIAAGPRALVISNLLPPDFVGGYELGAAELSGALVQECGWAVDAVCSARRGSRSSPVLGASPELHGYYPRGWANHHEALRLHGEVRGSWCAVRDRVVERARRADLALLFNPRRLLSGEWQPACAGASRCIAYVSDYWPAEYPGCDVLFDTLPKLQRSLWPLLRVAGKRWRRLYDAGLAPMRDLSFVSAAIYVSQHIRSRTEHAFPNLRASAVIPWGLRLEAFPYSPFDPSKMQTWGFAGRLQEEKGLHVGLDIFAALAPSWPNLRFLIAGDASTAYGRRMVSRVSRDPLLRERVEFLGKVPRTELVSRFYSRVGMLLFTSLWEEPFAITVLEAMACGALVFSTNRGGSPEIVNEGTGYLFDPERVDEAIGTARSILETPRQAEARQRRAREVVASQHSIGHMARAVDAFTRAHLRD